MFRTGLAFVSAAAVAVASAAVLAFAAPPDARRSEWRKAYVRPAAIPFPDDNPYTQAKADLGRALFFDGILSRSGTIACASCHLPSLGWTDGRAKPIGEGRSPLAYRAPTLLNIAWVDVLGWDGKFPDLESVAYTPLLGKANMNMTEPEITARLSKEPAYVSAFQSAFGPGPITRRAVELALATFERTIVSPEAPFDRWIAGDEGAISEAAKRGFDLFNGKAQCAECHSGWAMTDGSFHDIGTSKEGDIGRGRLFPTSEKLKFAFKTPGLRDVTRRSHFMHDGSLTSLKDVIALYDRGGIDRPSRSPKIKPLGLTDKEKIDLVAFLDTLTSDATTSSVTAYPMR